MGDSGNSGLLGLMWPSTRSGQRELDSVKTDLIAVERNLVSGNKTQRTENNKKIEKRSKHNKKKCTEKISLFTITSRLGGIGRVGSPAPMFIEQWYLLGKGHAMVGGMVG